MYDEEAVKARDAKAVAVLQERQSRVNGVMDNIYDGLGESSGTYNRKAPEQVANGFIAGYGGSFYATYDTIRHLESAVAFAYHAVANPLETATGIVMNAVASSAYSNAREGNYRAIGQDAGCAAGKMTQAAAARSATFPNGSWPTVNGYNIPLYEVHWSNHNRGDHANPHKHIFLYDSSNGGWSRGASSLY